MSESGNQEQRAGRGQRFLRLAFRLLYQELACTYDLVSWLVSLGQWRQWQLAGLVYLRGKRVLDLAHGPGHMLVALQDRGFLAVGLDLSPQMSRMAWRRLQGHNLPAHLARGRAQVAPFARGSFDSILVTFPAEFIAEKDAIAELFRLLSPGGRLVIVPEARLKGRGPLTSFIEWLYAITGQRPGYEKDGQPGTIWKQVAARFVEVGFQLSTDQVELPRSMVTIVIADKPNRN